jgi:hypothetical protein
MCGNGVRSMSPQRVIAIGRAAAVSLGLALAVAAGWDMPRWWALPVLIAAYAATEAASVRLSLGRQGATYALNDAVLAVALVLAPGGWIPVGAAAGYALVKFRHSPWPKFSFNLAAEHLFAVSAAVVVTQLAGDSIGAAALGLLAFAAVNYLMVAIPLSATSGVPYHRVLLALGPLAVVHNAGNASVGLLAAWLLVHEPIGLLGLLVPIGLLWWSYQQGTRRADEARLYAELAQGQEKVAGTTVDASAQVVVTAAARLLGGAEVEMLLRHPDGPVRYLGDEHGLSARLRADGDAFDAPWVMRGLSEGGVRTGHEADRPYCSAVLGDPTRPLAVLIARRAPRAASFSRGDAQLATVLAGQAEAWLSVADLTTRHDEVVGRVEAYGAASRVLGDIGQETVPALAVLRESANRLSRLATAFDGPEAVSEIVSELHAVERAVASLLGAIALASDPVAVETGELTGMVGSVGSVGLGETEWTTTGRIEDVEDAVRL